MKLTYSQVKKALDFGYKSPLNNKSVTSTALVLKELMFAHATVSLNADECEAIFNLMGRVSFTPQNARTLVLLAHTNYLAVDSLDVDDFVEWINSEFGFSIGCDGKINNTKESK